MYIELTAYILQLDLHFFVRKESHLFDLNHHQSSTSAYFTLVTFNDRIFGLK